MRQPKLTHRKAHNSACCDTNLCTSQRTTKWRVRFYQKVKTHSLVLCCIQFVSQEYYTPAILEKQQKILHNAQSHNSFNTPKENFSRLCTLHPRVSRKCDYVNNYPYCQSYPIMFNTKTLPPGGLLHGSGVFSAFQNCAASADLSCNCSLSAIRAINSEFVGLPLVLDTV